MSHFKESIPASSTSSTSAHIEHILTFLTFDENFCVNKPTNQQKVENNTRGGDGL